MARKDPVRQAEQQLEKARQARADLQAKLSAKDAEITARRSRLGVDVLEGGDLEALAADVAHLERERAALADAIDTADRQVALMDQAHREALQAANRTRANELLAQADQELRAVVGPMIPQLEALGAKLAGLKVEARAAYDAMPDHNTNADPQLAVLERRINALGLNGRALQFLQTHKHLRNGK